MGPKMINYDYECNKCQVEKVAQMSYEDRDFPWECPECWKGTMKRVYRQAPQMRTAKTSRTFIDGHKRPGMEDEKIVADLQVKQLNHKHTSEEYKQIKKEIKDRRKITVK